MTFRQWLFRAIFPRTAVMADEAVARHQAPPVRLPPSPRMADRTYGCERHFYDGCPNCNQGGRLQFPEIDSSLLPAPKETA